jgi:hypothetical protein
MAFSEKGLSTNALTKEAGMYHYVSADLAATVEAASYFDSVAASLPTVGIIIHYDTATPTVNIYAFTNDLTDVTLLTGAVAVTGPGVEFT